MERDFVFEAVVLLLIFFFTGFSKLALSSFDEDPIKATQSKVVPVTEELLTREGEPGPASPTYKMIDTSGFLVKKPYEEAEKKEAIQRMREATPDLWSDWFFWEAESEEGSFLEPVEEK